MVSLELYPGCIRHIAGDTLDSNTLHHYNPNLHTMIAAVIEAGVL